MFSPVPPANTELRTLGLLGKIAQNVCLIEPYRNQPSKTQVRHCAIKLFSYLAQLERKAKREDISLPEEDLPRLWILAPSASQAFLEGFNGRLELENWLPGVYFCGESWRTVIVAINQLPITQETLLLRILGKGEVQRQAISELLAFPKDSQFRLNVQQLLASWRITTFNQDNQDLTDDDQELIMNLSQAYLEWEQKTLQQGLQRGLEQGLQQGVQQGVHQGQRQIVENLLKVRFGSLDQELSSIVERILELPPEEYSSLLLQLSHLSREELIERFRS
ncbi:hypothetical protein G7B40_027145 [Aetokthonos hydrillicola Thurmond2011]|uniref:Flagellar assembly protein H n=1 Tax=Aetokthonos hydrillicola Thurmond2011 TaxID=2712845 RepID=A0AAP5IAZ8_9CYAN|nr:hypothetical protein [Aetokthonos hydrillicola]MDR9898210.1 hypothetical protein [Aetokthonos hydrillicola Thurmond2011]